MSRMILVYTSEPLEADIELLGDVSVPQWDRNLNSGGTPLAESALVAAPATQTVLHNTDHPTRITLPVRRL